MPWREYSPHRGRRLQWGRSRTHNLFLFFLSPFFFLFSDDGLAPPAAASICVEAKHPEKKRFCVALSLFLSPAHLLIVHRDLKESDMGTFSGDIWIFFPAFETEEKGGRQRGKLPIERQMQLICFGVKKCRRISPNTGLNGSDVGIILSVFSPYLFLTLNWGDEVYFTLLGIST